jgi:tetratricopeptide (TPR) repeat protein
MVSRKRLLYLKNFDSGTNRCLFDSLPDEVLKHIVTYLQKNVFLHARLVNKKLSKACDSMWIFLYRQTWQVPHRIVSSAAIAAYDSVSQKYFASLPRASTATTITTATVATTTTTTAAATASTSTSSITADPSTSSKSTPLETYLLDGYPNSNIFTRHNHHCYYSHGGFGLSSHHLLFSSKNDNTKAYIQNDNDYTREEQCELIWKELFFERYKILRFGQVRGKKVEKSKLSLFHSPRSSGYKSDPEHYTDKGYANIYRNDYIKATACFEKALCINPSARAYEGLARIYQQHCESPPHVVVFTEAALKLNPVNPGELHYLRGKALLSMNRLHEALNDFSRAIEYLTVSPVNYHLFLRTSDVYYDRMMTNLELGNFDQAFSDCEMVTKTERFFEGGDCFVKCARVLYDMKQFEQGERFLKQVKVKTLDYYLLFMRVQCMLGKYKDAMKSYKSYEIELKNMTQHASTHTSIVSNEILLDIGITLIMNNYITEGIEKFTESALDKYSKAFSTLNEKDLSYAKQQVKKAAIRQMNEYSRYFDLSTMCPVDIHTVWSFYYFLLGMLYFYKKASRLSTITGLISDSEDLKIAMTNFTRCITLNPTLSESFYYRALLRCYLLLDLPVSCLCHNPANSALPVHSMKFNSFLLQKMQQGYLGNTSMSNDGYKQIVQKITVTNLIREALNDVTNAITLITMNMLFEPFMESTTNSITNYKIEITDVTLDSKHHNDQTDIYQEVEMIKYTINLHLLKAYILNCLSRKQEALIECDTAIELSKQLEVSHSTSDSDSNQLEITSSKASPREAPCLGKCYALRAVISQEQEDVKLAYKLDKEGRLFQFPSLAQTQDLLNVIIYLSASSCNCGSIIDSES